MRGSTGITRVVQRLRVLALGLIIAVALVGSLALRSPAAHAAPAHAARAALSCSGWSCNGQDPSNYGCYASAWVVETYYYAHGWVKVFYSSGCNSNWYETGSYSGWFVAGYTLGGTDPSYGEYETCEGLASGYDEQSYCTPQWVTGNYWHANDIPGQYYPAANDWIGNMTDGQNVICGAAYLWNATSGNYTMSAGCH
jgi:hypothetical protein